MNQIANTPVESSTISHIGYSPITKTLAVRFISRGKTPPPPCEYRYSGIEPAFYQKLNESESKGRFIATNLIKTKAPFTKIELPTA